MAYSLLTLYVKNLVCFFSVKLGHLYPQTGGKIHCYSQCLKIRTQTAPVFSAVEVR